MNARIVVAEDEADIRQNLKRMLTLEGFDVWAGENGHEALALVREHQPDIVVSDVMMPVMTGHQLISALRADSNLAHIPVILLTARADRHDMREGMNLGADDYITKPFQRGELLDSIRSRIEKAAAQQFASKRLAAQNLHMAHHDSVTDLPNRRHFQLLLNAALQASRQHGSQPILMGISLDNLPEMAQVLSSGLMDDCVSTLSQRLQQLVRSPMLSDWGNAVVGRTADDRFVVLFERPAQGGDDTERLQQLLSQLAQPLTVDGEQHFPMASLAKLALDQPDFSAEAVLARLDSVLGHARQQPGIRLSVQSLESTQQLASAFRLHNDLHRAVERQELRVLYQPQVEAGSHRLVGFEALMRWHHQQLGLISPVQFIPMAEDNGQIVPMGQWILNEACQQAARWGRDTQAFATPPRMAVNLSMRQFVDPHMVRHVEQALAESGLPPHLLELEITEGTAMQDLQHTLKLLNHFKTLGVRLAIDDFGTGYSSLAYLKRFPLDVLKIDQSFVRNITTDADDRAIANAVIQLAHSLGMSVIAEGVEQRSQHDLLADMGCDECQGYLFAKPLPANDVPGWLATHQASLSSRD